MATSVNLQTPTGAGSLNSQNQSYDPILEFRAGVSACLSSWSALRTAVESGWGGGERESQKKAEDLRAHIFQKMHGKKCPLPNYDSIDLADDLAIYIEEEFSVTLEDDSERQLAEVIFQMYERCLNGDPTFARQMVTKAASAVALASQFPVQVQTTEHDDDDDEMDVAESSTMIGKTNATEILGQQLSSGAITPSNLVDYVSQPLFGKAKQQKSVPKEPVRQLGQVLEDSGDVEMDDDGFAPVKRGNRRR